MLTNDEINYIFNKYKITKAIDIMFSISKIVIEKEINITVEKHKQLLNYKLYKTLIPFSYNKSLKDDTINYLAEIYCKGLQQAVSNLLILSENKEDYNYLMSWYYKTNEKIYL